MDRIGQLLKNLSAWVGRMSAGQVMMLLGIVAGTIVGAIFLSGYINKVAFSRLYSDLDEAEAGEVVAYLNDNKIPYELSDGGRTVLVPSDQVYNARISLASEGLPRNGTMGYSLFDKNNLGMTDFLQNLNFRRALEGELTKTIMQLSEVKAARVHIVMPKDRLFKSDQKEATASVVLKLRGNGLSKQQVNGISHLVASSVEGLKPENISIIDYEGNLLSSGGSKDELAGLTASQLDVRKQAESYLEEKAQSMLDNVLGGGRSVIRVTAELDFAQVERTAETYDANAPAIRSEERTVSSQAAKDKADEASESEENGSTETTITNYELNKTMEHIINGVGSVKRLSIAVMVDGVYTPVAGEGGEETITYQPRSQEELDRLAAIVKNAVGYDSQRNDQIEMFNIAFDRRELMEDQQALDDMYQREFYVEIAKKVGLVVLAILALLYFRRKVGKLFNKLGTLMPPPAPVRPSPYAAGSSDATEAEPMLPRIIPEARKPRLVDEMQQAAKKDPEEIARAIKTMMSDV